MQRTTLRFRKFPINIETQLLFKYVFRYFLQQHKAIQTTAAEWLAQVLCIREVPGSNLGSEAAYPAWGFT
jgi:hypothetical protein